MKEAYLFYNELTNKDNIHFQIYTECTSTHDIHNKEIFMKWHLMSLDTF
jgi:hypothetical protein